MTRLCFLVPVFNLGLAISAAQADPVPEKYKPVIDKGLAWLAKEQQADGSWAVNNNQYLVAMTSLAGLALLMEGSTPVKGKHAEALRKATDWLVGQSQKANADDGMIGDKRNPTETGRYMFGHGYAVLFLSCVLPEEDKRENRRKIQDVLNRAVQFSAQAQSSKGGWFYTSKRDGHDQDEGATTLAQLQGLIAARRAGIPVPKALVQQGQKYLANMTSPAGAVYYSSASKAERPALTAGALACAGGNDDVAKQWWKYCHKNIALPGAARVGQDEYLLWHYTQAVHGLGDQGFAKLFPNEANPLQWSKFREALFDQLQKTQQANGSWTSGGGFSVGPVYSTSLNLMMLQLDNETVPIFAGAAPR